MTAHSLKASSIALLSLSFALLIDATFITIREVDFKNNADYAKVFIVLRNGTDQLRGNTMVDIDALVFQNISDGLQVRIDLASKIGADYVTMLDSSVDVCSLNTSATDGMLMELMVSEMNKYGNISISCPFNSGNYMARNFHIDTDNMLIKFAPPGDYRVGIDVKHKTDGSSIAIPIFDMEFYATIAGGSE
ncbi:uncharacterized protein LOC135711858 [Ochlerotatus camptorhynchus]|uniref:uncharacterized protein LOC135711858 n=1 Tax=Ochlerotatus camptorhynchus TaxID=644619 RepID=UPI0031DEAB7C